MGSSLGYRISRTSGPSTKGIGEGSGRQATASQMRARIRTRTLPRRVTRPGLLALLAGTAVALLIPTLILADVVRTWIRHRPLVEALATEDPVTTAYMARRASEGRPPGLRRWIPLESLPAPVVCAVVASENVNFFRHGALDWHNQRELVRRILRGDFSRGSSGISQQLARNLFLSPDRTPHRKLREYVLAFQLSRLLNKDRQLELYLNLVEWGEGVWGVAAGSEALFGRGPEALTPVEAVLLANVLPSPSRGLDFPLSPSRRGKLVRVATILWREAVLDDVAWSATVARLERLSELVDHGLAPEAAIRTAIAEMGAEPAVGRAGAFPASDWSSRCDPTRRGMVF